MEQVSNVTLKSQIEDGYFNLKFYISVIRCLGAVWAWPNLHGCTGATLGVELGVGIGVTFGMAVGVETRTAGLGSGVTGATDCGVH